jgi:hypothetical protein
VDLTAIELDAAKKSSPRWTLSGERRFESGESVFPKFWEIAGWPLYQNNWTLWQSQKSKNSIPACSGFAHRRISEFISQIV